VPIHVSFGKITVTQIRKNPKILTIDFSFRELEIFCKVVELEKFSKVAEAVFLVQASLVKGSPLLKKRLVPGCLTAWVKK
jgi:hypothetical protein